MKCCRVLALYGHKLPASLRRNPESMNFILATESVSCCKGLSGFQHAPE